MPEPKEKEPKEELKEEQPKEEQSDTQLKAVPGLVPMLLPHQETGVKFMLNREKHGSGGIQADAMGLGKTVQTIALILAAPAPSQHPTLVVVPPTLLDQWVDEFKANAPKLLVLRCHRFTNHDFTRYDVVVTTYSSVIADAKDAGPLSKTVWWRVIADEAHEFRNIKTKKAEAMLKLPTVDSRRWALTATPIHNKLSDILTLLTFIRVKSIDDLPSAMLCRSEAKLSLPALGNKCIELYRPRTIEEHILMAQDMKRVLARDVMHHAKKPKEPKEPREAKELKEPKELKGEPKELKKVAVGTVMQHVTQLINNTHSLAAT